MAKKFSFHANLCAFGLFKLILHRNSCRIIMNMNLSRKDSDSVRLVGWSGTPLNNWEDFLIFSLSSFSSFSSGPLTTDYFSVSSSLWWAFFSKILCFWLVWGDRFIGYWFFLSCIFFFFFVTWFLHVLKYI
jgi:hypothetical protein